MPRRLSIAIHLALAALLLLPLTYYSGADKRDERWAWRMFSPVRLERCASVFLLGDNETPLQSSREVFHAAWMNIANRGRTEVIEKMAAHLCQREEAGSPAKVQVRLLCEQYPGAARDKRLLYDLRLSESSDEIEVVSRGVFNLCKTESL